MEFSLGVISPYVFEELKNRNPLAVNTCPEALTEAMKQMAGGLPEEVGVLGSRGGPWFSLLRKKSSALDLWVFFWWIFLYGCLTEK